MKEIEKAKTQNPVGLIKYVPNSIVSKTIVCKNTGKIAIVAIDNGEELKEKVSPFDTFIQILEGKAEIFIDNELNVLQEGLVIIVPAHASLTIRAEESLKIMLTIIKSGYEENGM